MEEIRKLNDRELAEAYERVFREAFPPEELKPLGSMRKLRDRGQYDTLALFVDGAARGFICNWKCGDYVLIDYLCVEKGYRSGGIGARLLEKMMASYPEHTVFIGEVEAPEGDPEADEIRIRRLGFYERCGARSLSYETAIFGVHYKTIIWARGEVDEAEVLRHHEMIYRSNFPPQVYDRAVQIPLAPGEKPFDKAVWDERPNEDLGESEA